MTYAYYNKDTGELTSVTRRIDTEYGDSYVEIDKETHNKFITSEYMMHDFIVIAHPNNPAIKKLFKKEAEEVTDTGIKPKEIKKVKSISPNNFIIQQTTDNEWSITNSFDEVGLEYYCKIDGYLQKVIEVYLVPSDNYNNLLEKIVIPYKDILTNKPYNVIVKNKVRKCDDTTLISYSISEDFVNLVEDNE
jgi:hypothetical protein